MPDVVAVPQARRRAVVSGSQDAPIFDDDRADARPVAGAPLGDLKRDAHEVVVPRGAFVFGHACCSPGLFNTNHTATARAGQAIGAFGSSTLHQRQAVQIRPGV